MANEAYRAVFLRVHPTGKMVLSLTTEADGREAVQALLRQFERDMKRQDPALTAGIIDELRATLGIS